MTRGRGDLTTNSFVTIKKTMDEDRKRRIVVVTLGDAEALKIEIISGLWRRGWNSAEWFRSTMSVGAAGSGDITKSSAKRYTTSATQRLDLETAA